MFYSIGSTEFNIVGFARAAGPEFSENACGKSRKPMLFKAL